MVNDCSHRFKQYFLLACTLIGVIGVANAQISSYKKNSPAEVERHFKNPPTAAKPWVFWYWMQAAVSKEGITADLEAMKEAGIAGAYLMPIKDSASPSIFQPAVRQLTAEWWEMVRFSMQEAKRLNLQLGMHVSDGFALAGGPWITPEMSMQKLVWTKTYVKGGEKKKIDIQQPEGYENYYEDVALLAYPANCTYAFSDEIQIPTVTTSNGSKAPFLSYAHDGKDVFRSDTSAWIQYTYPDTFTCRSIKIHTSGNNYQAHRLIIQSSDDGVNFKTITRLQPPRHGWQDTDEDVTHSIPKTTAKYFRFVYDKAGSEPGAEDLDAAKWKPALRIMGIYLSDEPVINQYEGKNGSIWRISELTTTKEVPANNAIPLKSVINLTGKLTPDNHIEWDAPEGNWVIVRIGHTSTGHTNATGGAGKGLECDKFSPAAIKMQFDNWFAKAFEKTDPILAKEVLKYFHVDSWECGSQNWNKTFAAEFKKRRGYNIGSYILAMTGVPVESASQSEKFLHDVRQTITELINDVFYSTLAKLAKSKGCYFSAESIAPTMLSDGMLHYNKVDLPMGEFWLNSPTHDKPNDMLDAISGAHVYGKNIIQAEAFTSVRMNWAEHPGMLKTLQDRNYALGINKLVYHVYTHNPWLNRKPGMTLDGVGLYFQRDQTWWKPGKAWVDYAARCQALLQQGKPVVDIAVFTGEELPRRSLLPDRLVQTLPGIIGKERVAANEKRLRNEGEPLRSIPDGVSHSANMADPEDWVNPLNGYAYDSFNPDALQLATVKNGNIILPGGASYKILVVPAVHVMQPNKGSMSLAVAKKIAQLVNAGATILIDKNYDHSNSLNDSDDSVQAVLKKVFASTTKGKIISIPYTDPDFSKIGLTRDVEIGEGFENIAWTHRSDNNVDIYFISNQENKEKEVTVSFRVGGKEPELWDAVTGKMYAADFEVIKGRTDVKLRLEQNESVFIVFRTPAKQKVSSKKQNTILEAHALQNWIIQFDTAFGGPSAPQRWNDLQDWSVNDDPKIKYYSGTAIYKTIFDIETLKQDRDAFLELRGLHNIASIQVNGKDMGVLWTAPFRMNIGSALKKGKNTIEIAVSNTWHNRLIYDQTLHVNERVTNTTAPFRLQGKPLKSAGLLGPVEISY